MSKHMIVSFFATPPDQTDFPTTDYPPLEDGSVDPTFLPATWSALKAKGGVPWGPPTAALIANPPEHIMVRVPSVRQMGLWFSAYALLGSTTSPVPKLRVQLIGHSGRRGQLALGGGWPQPVETWEPPFYWFDSNPNALQMLARPIVIDVMLAGCYIAQRQSNVTAVNGRSLLFALSELWRCRTRGAITSVDPNDFSPCGWYEGPDGAKPVGWSWDSNATTFDDTGDQRWAPQPITDKRIAPPARITSSDGTVADAGLIAGFLAYFDSTMPKEQWPRAAIPDVNMTFDYGSRSTPAYLVSNATFLMVGSGADRVCYANANRAYSADVAEVVARLAPPQLTDGDPDDPASS